MLRAATRADHEAVDRMLSEFDLAQPVGYAAFLNIHLAALRSLEAQWRHEDRGDFLAMCRCLEADLGSLGVASAPPTAALPSMSVGGRLGAAYVMRGSRLGAAVLRRRVPAHFAAAYLGFLPVLSWPEFLRELDRAAQGPSGATNADAIDGARLTFRLFAGLSARAVAAP